MESPASAAAAAAAAAAEVTAHSPHLKGHPPSPREAHSMVALANNPQRILVFGGGCSNSLPLGPQQFNDLFLLDLKELHWSPIQSKGLIPSPRTGQSAVSLGDGRVVFFGGSSMAEGYNNQVYVLHTKDWEWSQPHISGTPPCPRDKHSACLIGTNLYVFGGFGPVPFNENIPLSEDEEAASNDDDDDSENYSSEEENELSMSFRWFDDLHVLDTRAMSWQRKETSGERPSPRAAHAAFITACVDGENGYQMMVFAGRGPTGRQNDLFTLNLNTFHWSKKGFYTSNGDCSSYKGGIHTYIPAPRSFHVMLPFGDGVQAAVTYGGIGANGEMFRGLEVLDLRTMKWTGVGKLKGSWPPLRGASAMVALVSDPAVNAIDTLVIFGGSCPSEDKEPIYFNDVYIIDIRPLMNLLEHL